MFWDRYTDECAKKGKKPNPVAAELGIASSAVTGWKNGALPKTDVLIKLSRYFGVSVDYLLCCTDAREIRQNISLEANDIAVRYDALDKDGQALVRVAVMDAEDRMRVSDASGSKKGVG